MKKSLKVISVVVLSIFCLFYTSCNELMSLLFEPEKTEETKKDDETTDPSNPTNPTNPTDPTNPTNPTDPTDPTQTISTEKTLSNYVDGMRYITVGDKSGEPDDIFISTIQPQPKPDYSAIDNAVKNLDIPTDKSFEEAAQMILKAIPENATTKEKARALYTWICMHVDYNYYGRNNSDQTAEGAFKERLAVCGGYADLAEKLGKAMGLNCDTRIGLVATGEGREKLNPDQHAWNKITPKEAPEQCFLMDTTWGSCGTLKEGKSMDDQWFDPDPCYFVFSHWAEDQAVLVSPEIGRDDYLSLPVIYPSFEKNGIDGKEILEFCLSHNISEVANLYPASGTNLLKLPICKSLTYNKEYTVVWEVNGKAEEKRFTADYTDGQQYCNVSLGSYNTYGSLAYAVGNGTIPALITGFKAPHFILYDDKAEFILGTADDISVGNGKWKAVLPLIYHDDYKNPRSIAFYPADSNYGDKCALYDAVFQEWIFISGGYFANDYYGYQTMASRKFDADLTDVLKPLITKMDSSIALDRKGGYSNADYNVVYVPLSKEDEVKKAVLNYDYTQDKEFAEFVSWMEKHNVRQKDIDFYIEMAKYPLQRGQVLKETSINIDATRYVGADYYNYPYCPPLFDEDGKYMNVGGMQQYLEFRKQEKRHLFRNQTIPILMVHIVDTDKTTHEKMPENFFVDEEANIKKKLATAGLKNTFEINFVEIELSYKDFKDNYIPGDENFVSGFGHWAKIEWGTDFVLAKIKEKDPALAEKFSDTTKTAIIKYFDEYMMNWFTGSNKEVGVVTRLDQIISDLGYSRHDHINLFGSIVKTDSPSCFDMNCVRETAICPLCMYSYDID